MAYVYVYINIYSLHKVEVQYKHISPCYGKSNEYKHTSTDVLVTLEFPCYSSWAALVYFCYETTFDLFLLTVIDLDIIMYIGR